MNNSLVNNIANYSEKYRANVLSSDSNLFKKSKENWYSALKFFLNIAFYQGRKNELSTKIKKAAFNYLDNLYSEENRKSNNPEQFAKKIIIGRFQDESGKEISRKRDVEMVKSSLKFIYKIDNSFNLVNYSITKIKNGNIKELQKELDGIVSVGEKISALFLDQLIIQENLEGKIDDKDKQLLLPFDVWVDKVCIQIGIYSDKASLNEKKKKVFETCKNADVNSINFIRGVWYIGYKSLELFLETLKENNA